MIRRIETRCPECRTPWHREHAFVSEHWGIERVCLECKTPLQIRERGEGPWRREAA